MAHRLLRQIHVLLLGFACAPGSVMGIARMDGASNAVAFGRFARREAAVRQETKALQSKSYAVRSGGESQEHADVGSQRQMLRPSVPRFAAHKPPACAALTNRGTHFTVEVSVGTPAKPHEKPQTFNVVADTGSNSLIIPSCLCKEAGKCSEKDACFRGSGRSSTFSIDERPLSTLITFGSGTVRTVIASDVVHLGGLHVNMSDGVLLMTDHALSLAGAFEGILGLGLPAPNVTSQTDGSDSPLANSDKMGQHSGRNHTSHSQSVATDGGNDIAADLIDAIAEGHDHIERGRSMHKMLQTIKQTIVSHVESSRPQEHRFNHPAPVDPDTDGDDPNSRAMEKAISDWINGVLGRGRGGGGVGDASSHGFPFPPKHSGSAPRSTALHSKGLLEAANVHNFSMCFNDEGSSGALRLGSFDEETALGSIGQVHWGLGLEGLSIGSEELSVNATVCAREDMSEGQSTPCGAIPDSGTTVIMAPKEHIQQLYTSVCDGWERCLKNFTAYQKAREDAKAAAIKAYGTDPFGLPEVSKAEIFKLLLLDCNTWMNESHGLAELPDVNFHVTGHENLPTKKHRLSLSGWAYVLEQRVRAKSLDDVLGPAKRMGIDSGMEEINSYIEQFRDPDPLSDGGDTAEQAGPAQRKDAASGKAEDMAGTMKVCTPAFGEMDYRTQKNGPVWILGTPFFYEFNVGYDIKSVPPRISFKKERCNECASGAALMSRSDGGVRGEHVQSVARNRPRRVWGAFRYPAVDTTLPL